MVMKKKVNIFDYLNQIYNKTEKLKYDKKLAPAYMLSMWLSHDLSLLNTVQEMNFLQFDLPDKIIYDYYFHSIPKRKRYIKWTKKTPEDKKKDKDIKEIKERYNVSKMKAKEILGFQNLLPKEKTDEHKYFKF